ncbi:MAG TPA: PQQ-binding-like beta-propeller repeat protein [Trebonia sp.]
MRLAHGSPDGDSQSDIQAGTALLNMPAAAADQITYGVPENQDLSVDIAPGLVLFQSGVTAVEAVNPATGKVLWNTKLPTPQGFSEGGTPPILGFTVANGLISVYDSADYLWWIVNQATGAASPPHRLASYSQPGGAATDDVLPLNSGNVILVNDTNVQDIDPAIQKVRWQVPVHEWSGEAMIGSMLYLDNDPYDYDYSHHSNTNPTGSDTAIQRIDLARGQVLPSVALAKDLQDEGGQVSQFGADPGVLMVVTSSAVARIDPATGKAIWFRALPVGTVGVPQAAAGTPSPSIEYLVRGGASEDESADGSQPVAGTGNDIWRVQIVSLANGALSPVALGRSFPYASAGVDTRPGSQGIVWNGYGSSMLAAPVTAPKPAGSGEHDYTRLEGVVPATGHVLWKGPAVADLAVLGQTPGGQSEVILESCPPSEVTANPSPDGSSNAYCNGETLYAVNT